MMVMRESTMASNTKTQKATTVSLGARSKSAKDAALSQQFRKAFSKDWTHG